MAHQGLGMCTLLGVVNTLFGSQIEEYPRHRPKDNKHLYSHILVRINIFVTKIVEIPMNSVRKENTNNQSFIISLSFFSAWEADLSGNVMNKEGPRQSNTKGAYVKKRKRQEFNSHKKKQHLD